MRVLTDVAILKIHSLKCPILTSNLKLSKLYLNGTKLLNDSWFVAYLTWLLKTLWLIPGFEVFAVAVSCALLQSCSYWLAMDVLKIISHHLVFFFLFFKLKLWVQTAVWALQYCVSAISLYHSHTSNQSSRKVLVFPHCTKTPYTCFKNCLRCSSVISS